MFNAIDQVVRGLARDALVERERLQAGEADQVGMLDLLRGDAVAAEQFGLDLGDLVKVEDDGRMRDVQCRDRAFGRQRLYPAASDVRRIRQQFQYHQRTVFSAGLPPPGELYPSADFSPLETHILEV